MENPGTFIVLGHRFAITLDGILNQQWRPVLPLPMIPEEDNELRTAIDKTYNSA